MTTGGHWTLITVVHQLSTLFKKLLSLSLSLLVLCLPRIICHAIPFLLVKHKFLTYNSYIKNKLNLNNKSVYCSEWFDVDHVEHDQRPRRLYTKCTCTHLCAGGGVGLVMRCGQAHCYLVAPERICATDRQKPGLQSNSHFSSPFLTTFPWPRWKTSQGQEKEKGEFRRT